MSDFIKGFAKVLRRELGLKRIGALQMDAILSYLDSEGLVIKVEGRLPEYQSRYTDEANEQMFRKAGWSKVRRFI